MDLDLDPAPGDKAPSTRIIVRLTRTAWHDGTRFEVKTRLSILKRRSCLIHNFLDEDCDNIGALDVLLKVVNLNTSDDGVYALHTCNEKRDWETGYVDDYDYRLDRVYDMVAVALKMPDGRIVQQPPPARHSDLFFQIQKEGVPPTDMVKPEIVQGFIRDDGQFVDRKTATDLVGQSGQNRKPLRGHLLTSEDLW